MTSDRENKPLAVLVDFDGTITTVDIGDQVVIKFAEPGWENALLKFKAGEIRTTGSGISRFLNLQNQKFSTVSCTRCGYTDVYRMDASGKIGNIFDILTN